MLLLILILIIGGAIGFYMFTQKAKAAEEEERVTLKEEEDLKDTSKFTAYTECEYMGFNHDIVTEDGTLESSPGFKSIIIPEGFTVDTYTKPEKGGIKISYSGPTTLKCLSTTIPYIEWRKV